MGKQARTADMEDFKEEIKAMLEHQNDRMEHLIWQVTGSEGMGIEGLKPALKRIEKDVHDIKKWREEMWKLDLKKMFTWEIIKKAVTLMVSIGGGAYVVFESLKHMGLGEAVKNFIFK